jgi:hypothetical protein
MVCEGFSSHSDALIKPHVTNAALTADSGIAVRTAWLALGGNRNEQTTESHADDAEIIGLNASTPPCSTTASPEHLLASASEGQCGDGEEAAHDPSQPAGGCLLIQPLSPFKDDLATRLIRTPVVVIDRKSLNFRLPFQAVASRLGFREQPKDWFHWPIVIAV